MVQNDFEATQTRFRPVVKDHRAYPRIRTNRRAQVILPSGETANVTIRDISPDGVQLRCGRAAARLIHPSGRSVRRGDPGVVIRLVLTLPLRRRPTPIGFRGRLLHFALINTDLVSMGVEFGTLSSAANRVLYAFISESLEY